jgi:hypothetical protein
MRSFLVTSLTAMTILTAYACGGAKKGGPAGGGEGVGSETAGETCCCKSTPMTSEDGQPVYENGNPMECSSKQGSCVDAAQCAGAAQPE